MNDDGILIDLMANCYDLNEEPDKALEWLDDVNPSPNIIRSTLKKCPDSKTILDQCGLPLGFLVEPLQSGEASNRSTTIAYCYECDGYVNPFTQVINEYEWTCNFCGSWNSLAVQNKCHLRLDCPIANSLEFPRAKNEQMDVDMRRINTASKANLADTYLYVFDTSRRAVESGYLPLVADVILSELDALAQSPSARMGFVTFGREIHLYKLQLPHRNRLERFVLTDLAEMVNVRTMMIPRSVDFLLNVEKDQDLIVDFLRDLACVYGDSSGSFSALAPALNAVYEIIQMTGGRVTVFQSSQPNTDEGINVANLADYWSFTSDELYREISMSCRYQSVTVDLFLLGGHVMDIPSLSVLCKETGGSIFRFPDFHGDDVRERENLERSLRHYLTRFIGFASVMRIYMSPELSLVNVFGSCRVSEEGALITIVTHPDSAFGFEVTINSDLIGDRNEVYFQLVVSYTSKRGEFLTRVHTLCLPVVDDVHQIVQSADAECLMGLLSKFVTLWMVDSSCVDRARKLLSSFCVKFLKVYNTTGQRDRLDAPDNLKLLPYYVFNLLNSQVFKKVRTSYELDNCAYLLHLFNSLPVSRLMDVINPISRITSEEYYQFLVSTKTRVNQPTLSTIFFQMGL